MKFSGIFFILILASDIYAQRDRNQLLYMTTGYTVVNQVVGINCEKDTTTKKKTKEKTSKESRRKNEKIKNFNY